MLQPHKPRSHRPHGAVQHRSWSRDDAPEGGLKLLDPDPFESPRDATGQHREHFNTVESAKRDIVIREGLLQLSSIADRLVCTDTRTHAAATAAANYVQVKSCCPPNCSHSISDIILAA